MITWILLAVLAVGVVTLVTLMAVGRLTLDLRWGRTITPLGPITVRVSAPRSLLFEQLAAPYLGRTPAALRDKLEVVERGDDLVLALHRTRVGWYAAETVETVRFVEPERIEFRHVRGPVPHAVEAFELSDLGDETDLTYRGEIGLDLWFVGWLAARLSVKSVWERRVRESMDQAKEGAEARAAARARRERPERP